MRNAFISVVWLVLCSFACTDRPSYTDIIETAKSLADSNPDSAFSVLSAIPGPEPLLPKDRADYGSLVSLIHFKQGKAMAEDSLVLYSLAYYKEYGQTDKLPLAYFLVANYYKWRDKMSGYRETIREGVSFAS